MVFISPLECNKPRTPILRLKVMSRNKEKDVKRLCFKSVHVHDETWKQGFCDQKASIVQFLGCSLGLRQVQACRSFVDKNNNNKKTLSCPALFVPFHPKVAVTA